MPTSQSGFVNQERKCMVFRACLRRRDGEAVLHSGCGACLDKTRSDHGSPGFNHLAALVNVANLFARRCSVKFERPLWSAVN